MTAPPVRDPSLVGTYPALTKSGGGYVWDAVLEYRVWCHPLAADPAAVHGDDYFVAFATYEEAVDFAALTEGAEEPLALILQEEYIDEPEPGRFRHVREPRLTEWRVEWLSRPQRTAETIPDFLHPDRLRILRGPAN